MDFQESVTLQLPKISMENFRESKTDSGLIIEQAAIHHGLTANFNNYTSDELEASLETWVQPYAKPIILNHDPDTDPIGRVMAARMDQESDGIPFIRLQYAVLKTEAIERFADGRYLTGSVGGKVTEADCSICETNWAAPDAFKDGMPCAHERGKVYKGQMAYFNMKGITWKEYSIVNVPADQRSTVLTIGANGAEGATDTGEDQWVKAHFFSVGLSKESIVELSESGERNLLDGMKRKEATPLYHGLRGAYLVAIAESLDDNEENDVAEETTEDHEDDVLAVSDALSADLAADEETEDSTEDSIDEEVEDTESDEAGEGSDEDAAADEDEEDKDEEPEPEAEADDQADAAGDDEDASDEPVDEGDSEDSGEEDEADEDAETTADAGDESDERIVALEADVARLTEENAKLRNALKRGLAERVVDTKISLGLHEVSERSEQLESHMTRTAASLADSLRDLAGIKAPANEAPVAEGKSGSVDDSGRTTTTEATDDQQDKIDPVKLIVADAEEYLAGVMLGRKRSTKDEI